MDSQRFVRLLSIAGSDSGGGAGIQADLKTFAALGCYGMTAITAITAQNTLGVTAIHSVPVAVLQAQMDAVVSDLGVDAVKIGMLHDVPVIRTVAAAVQRHGLSKLVLDPVMVTATGARLIEAAAQGELVQALFPLAQLITPNVDEAALLLGQELHGPEDLLPAAEQLLRLGARAVLLKGAHLAGDTVHDLLLEAGQAPLWMQGPRVATPNLHGSGCTLSSAIAAHLGLGADLATAVQAGRDFVQQALQGSAQVRMGQGVGPLNHGFAPLPLQVIQCPSTIGSP